MRSRLKLNPPTGLKWDSQPDPRLNSRAPYSFGHSRPMIKIHDRMQSSKVKTTMEDLIQLLLFSLGKLCTFRNYADKILQAFTYILYIAHCLPVSCLVPSAHFEIALQLLVHVWVDTLRSYIWRLHSFGMGHCFRVTRDAQKSDSGIFRSWVPDFAQNDQAVSHIYSFEVDIETRLIVIASGKYQQA